MMDGNWDGGQWWWMATMMVAFWAIVVWGIVMLVRRPGRPLHRDASELLDERYARGEIDEDEYRRRRETLVR